MNTIVFHPESDPNAVRDAAAILRRGGLLGIPTETVYGLGADALNEDAVSRIFLAKGRPQDNPLIIHVPDASWLERYCRDVPPAAYQLAERFWPGPLTMILPRRDIVPLQTTGGLETVGVRCPNHPVTLAIIEAAGVPIAAPSGNTSGRPSPTTAAHMIEDMDGKIDGIVDGGPCTVGVESTIIDLTVTPPRLLRPGGLPLESLRQVLGEDLRQRIDRRVDDMVRQGLLQEVQDLLDSGLPRDATALQAIGYKQFLAVADGAATTDQAVEEVKLRSRQYAKRQLTWLRRNPDIHWILWDREPDFPAALQNATDFLTAHGLG